MRFHGKAIGVLVSDIRGMSHESALPSLLKDEISESLCLSFRARIHVYRLESGFMVRVTVLGLGSC